MKAVIFDMDGVLTDSEPLICAAAMAMFREHGLTVRPAMSAVTLEDLG